MVSLITVGVIVSFVAVFVLAAYLTVWTIDRPEKSKNDEREYSYADQNDDEDKS